MEEITKLWDHQRYVVNLCKDKNSFALFMGVGVGKTATVINILRQKCTKEKRLLKTLVLAPLITVNNWKREMGMHSKIKDVTILEGSQKDRIKQFKKHSTGPHVFVTNHQTMAVMKDLVKEFHDWGIEFLIVDEIHLYKDGTSKRTKALIKLSDTIKYKFGLTGTAILNSPMDIFSQFRILFGGFPMPYGMEKNFLTWRSHFFYDKNSGMGSHVYFPNWQIRPESYEKLNAVIQKYSYRISKEECLDLPDEVEEIYDVELSDEQRRVYEEMRKDFISYVDSSVCVAQLALTKALRLMQITSGFVKLEDGTIKRFDKTPRQEALKELLSSIPDKIVVWSVFKENYSQIKEVCEELKLSYVECHGDIPNEEKFKNVDTFNNDPNCRVFIGHAASGGIGINLVSSNYSIFYSRNFSLGEYLQAKARIHRAGQKRKVTHLNLSAKLTLDETVTKALANKLDVSNKLLIDTIRGGEK